MKTARLLKKMMLPSVFQKTRNPKLFSIFWDLAELGLEPGDAVEYYFEVWDNDGVNGSKSTKSEKQNLSCFHLE